MMFYKSYHPEDRDDILSLWKQTQILPINCSLTLVNSGTGSGKTKIIIDIINRSIQNLCRFCIFQSEALQLQAEEAIKKSESNHAKIYNARHMTDKDSKNLINDIKNRKEVAVFDHNLGHNSGEYTKNTKKILDLIDKLKKNNIKMLMVFDEIHLQFASTTGGAQIRVDINETNIFQYKKYCKTSHLNIFLEIQKQGIPVIGLSATLNDTICSKLPMISLDYRKTRIINFYPIPELYADLQIRCTDTSDFEELVPHLEQAERVPNKKTLLVFPNLKQLKCLKKTYKDHFKKDISGVEWTCETTLERRSKKEFNEKLKNARYILCCDLLNTGFDLSTYVEGQEFNLLILFRELSDKTTNPLSGNPKNVLCSESSANFIQVISRLRKGGLVLIDRHKFRSPHYSLYEMQLKVSKIIKKGHSKWRKIGSFESMSIMDRYYLCRLVAIYDNYRNDDTRERKSVEDFLNKTDEKYNRNFILDYETENMDWSFWIQVFHRYITDKEYTFSDSESFKEPTQSVSYRSCKS